MKQYIRADEVYNALKEIKGIKEYAYTKFGIDFYRDINSNSTPKFGGYKEPKYCINNELLNAFIDGFPSGWITAEGSFEYQPRDGRILIVKVPNKCKSVSAKKELVDYVESEIKKICGVDPMIKTYAREEYYPAIKGLFGIVHEGNLKLPGTLVYAEKIGEMSNMRGPIFIPPNKLEEYTYYTKKYGTKENHLGFVNRTHVTYQNPFTIPLAMAAMDVPRNIFKTGQMSENMCGILNAIDFKTKNLECTNSERTVDIVMPLAIRMY